MPRLHLATFKVDTAIPLGHPLCGGWIKPAAQVTEPLHALGVVLLGEESPIVLCAVDWCGINNEAHFGLAGEVGPGGAHDAGARGRALRASAQRPLRGPGGRTDDR